MDFLDTLKSLLEGGQARDRTGYWIYVRCGRCGEAIKARVDLYNDLSIREKGDFRANKTLVGSRRCFERIEVMLTFNQNRRLSGREIVGGDFITAGEFEAAESS
ncbi:MAG: hypothetical protein JSV81_13485 [Anaerolineales bacterium]|nr:MAG: hypothetical protein JSV81_13485 [Anaerolineales bacterium]